MRTIVRVTPYSKNGKSLVCLELDNKQLVHISNKQLAAQGFGTPTLLVGSQINVTFYDEGEELFSGATCTEDNTIVKEFSVQPSIQLAVAMSLSGQLAASMGLFGTAPVATAATPQAQPQPDILP